MRFLSSLRNCVHFRDVVSARHYYWSPLFLVIVLHILSNFSVCSLVKTPRLFPNATLEQISSHITQLERNQFISPLNQSWTRQEIKASKWLPFLVVIGSETCNNDDPTQTGTCATINQCKAAGGIARGKCSSGYGVCCVVTALCGATVSQNATYFQSRSFPEVFSPQGMEVCSIRVQKPSKQICQLRLDFYNMELAPGNSNGHCRVDNFKINGVKSQIPPQLCGSLSGQHMYIELGSSKHVTITIRTDGRGDSVARSWNIQMSYIRCDSPQKAPPGCLQYFTEVNGNLKILGWPMVPHLARLQYSVCIRRDDDAGAIIWYPCLGEPIARSFLMEGTAQTPNTRLAGSGNCNRDYIMIMSDESSSNDEKADDRYCGNSLTATSPFTIASKARPFLLHAHTDNTEKGQMRDVENTGFCLDWIQVPYDFE